MTRLVTKPGRASAPRRKASASANGAATARRDGARSKPGAAKAGRTERRARTPRGGGQAGRRLADAFEAVSHLVAMAESRRRLLRTCERETSSPGDLAEVIESDPALVIAVMRAAANAGSAPLDGGVRQAVEALSTPGVRALAAAVDVYDPFEAPSAISGRHERFRRHAVATRHAADRIAELARLGERDELAVSALLHDVGRLVLAELYGTFEGLDGADTAPDERIRRERRELGIDHALVGAVLVRRWGLPPAVAAAIERHHASDAEGQAAVIRLADLIVHFADGDPAPPEALAGAAARLGIERERLIPMLYQFPHTAISRRRSSDPCPLSDREIDALRGLAEGKVYKQIAHELSLSVSTIRTHLHNVYRKVGAVDRAQAVLIARDRGWI
jgi:putative nucleotidyltransferase with HDIG domain